MNAIQPLIDIVSAGGAPALMIVILVLGSRGIWVFGRSYEEMRRDRDEWKSLAQKATANAEALTAILEKGAKVRA